jgi:hypothetical protein
MADADTVIDWLLDPEHSDPSIRWQVMRWVTSRAMRVLRWWEE